MISTSLRGAMRQDRHVGEHFMVAGLVALGRLDDAVERQDAAEIGVFEDNQVLQFGLRPEQDL